MAKKRKVCKECGGSGLGQRTHAANCLNSSGCFDGECGCEFPKCPECMGTGTRERHKDKAVREVMES